jgi:hypothetical protein
VSHGHDSPVDRTRRHDEAVCAESLSSEKNFIPSYLPQGDGGTGFGGGPGIP